MIIFSASANADFPFTYILPYPDALVDFITKAASVGKNDKQRRFLIYRALAKQILYLQFPAYSKRISHRKLQVTCGLGHLPKEMSLQCSHKAFPVSHLTFLSLMP
ncbi:uncharacterized protein LOC129590076 [Paramacrobiotus metropolitanus]|uniref:uncharacterized protein LOC129590076 n=1 Tax=Paramacrobiotus metropolitanus TaxID=2943436 RepID=UPI0024463014|nr:uncharacterized protein LOC129590076 [Paramacrobiotus metropolitanus]